MTKKVRKPRNSTSSKKNRSNLLIYALDNIKKESFSVIRDELKKVLGERAGVYALYRGDKLVYVGLATNIFHRLRSHSRGKKKWDNASIFIIKKTRYLRDVETAIVRIAKPQYNSQKGRVSDERYLKRLLRNRVADRRKQMQHERRENEWKARRLQRDINKIVRVIAPPS